MNLFILITVFTLQALTKQKFIRTDQENESKYYQNQHYYLIGLFAKLISEYYVDLFLLWLLYRFMKPLNVLPDGKTEASALLFAHDNKRAQEILLNSYSQEEEKRQGDLLEKKHRDFIDFVIKEYISEIATET